MIQRQVDEEEEEPLQAKEKSGHALQSTPDLEYQIQSFKSGGQPLPKFTRDFFEPRFGVNFSHVRVHTNPKDSDTARALNAQAYTVGRDVVFGTGQYAPETNFGKKLLAHELTHVIQQKGMVQNKIQRRELRGEDFPWSGIVANCYKAWFRKEAKMGNNKIQALNRGTEVKITGKSGNWLKVEYNGENGSIYKNYIIHKFEAEAQKDISGVCGKASCLTKSGCTKSNCEKEASIIAEKYVSRVNTIRKPNIANVGDQHWGWLCFQWAGLLMREFSKLNLKCWKINWVGIVGGTNSLEHNYVFVSLEDITPSGTDTPKRGCGMILDPWRSGDPIVYDVSWNWHKWNYVHNPATDSGKYYSSGTWKNATSWWTASGQQVTTPGEPAPSPTIKVP